jgi:thiamine-phosphate pyrophosphorylase
MRRRTTDLGPQRHQAEVRGPKSEVRSPLLYYITDRSAFPGNESSRRCQVLEKISEAARAGVDYIQLREKDLTTRELERLASEAVEIIAEIRQLATGNRQPATALLINSRTDVALASGAAGVHLPSNDISPLDVRKVWSCGAGTPARELSPRTPVISISCHSPEEVSHAAANAADLAIFAPVFEKKDAGKKDTPGTPPAGLTQLREACQNKIPVIALGGITLKNARSCLDAGAAGIAAIRLFQDNDIAAVVRDLRC